MFAGCFSLCRPFTHFYPGKKTAGSKTSRDKALDLVPEQDRSMTAQTRVARMRLNKGSPENTAYTVADSSERLSAEKQVVKKKLDENPSAITPAPVSVQRYLTASGKEVLKVLESAAGIIPVPMLREAIGVALKIIELCEEASAIEQKVKELEDRVGYLMIVILAHVTDQNEEGDTEMVVKSAKAMEEGIKELLDTLGTINKELAVIQAQNRWVIALYKELNTTTLDDCLKRLSIALDNFKFANDLRDSDLLHHVHIRLGKMANQVDGLSKDMKHVVSTVDNIQVNLDNTRQAFDRVMARVKRSATLLSSDSVVRQQMPLRPDVFYGRDSLVDDIVQLLIKEEAPRISLLGPGGMGKTSVALAVVESPLVQERFASGKCVWVPCIGATSPALLLEILHVQLQIPGDKQVTLERIMSELKSTSDPHLILLDNFETPWNNASSQKEVEDVLRQLANFRHLAILITMRGKYPPCETAIQWESKIINPTDEEASFRIFHRVNPESKDDPGVGRLLEALGHMPFAVTLMASLGKEGQSTAGELLEAWTESGPDILSDNPEKSMNRSISLSVDSPLVQQNSSAVLLLAILSLLPAGTTKKNLRWWAPTLKMSMIPSAIATLSKAALLQENKTLDSDSPVLFVVPVVQSFMQQHGRISEEIRKQVYSSCCDYVLEYACRFDEPEFAQKSKALSVEDTNIQSILFSSLAVSDIPSSDRTMEAMIAFCWYRCDTKPNPDLAKYAVAMAEASGIKKYIALAEWCLGRTYNILFQNNLAIEHITTAYEIFSSPGDLEWAKLGCKCGIDLIEPARHLFDILDPVPLARSVEEKCRVVSDDLIHGRSLVYLGFALGDDEETEEALDHLERAKVMLESTGNALNIAEVYQAISRMHHYENRIPEAVEAVEESWKQAKTSSVPYIQADVSLDYAHILFSADRDADAMQFVEIALTTNSYVGNQFQVSMALECMGYGYLRQGQLEDAVSAYSAAAESYSKINMAQHLEWCQENIASIKQKVANPWEEVGVYRPRWGPELPLYFPSIPPSVSGNECVSASK